MTKNIIAIIPARGGSKGIPKKNIINIAGKPLIGWTIEQSINTFEISKTYVSTDSKEIAKVAKKYGAEIIIRPDEISSDTASSESAILHAIKFIEKQDGFIPDYIVFLQATSPLRKPDDIKNAIAKIIDDNSDSLFSASKFDDFLFWGEKDNEFTSINYNYKNRLNRQKRPSQYVENGSIYIFKPGLIIKDGNRLGGKISIFEMDFWQIWEIDNPEDIELIEYYIYHKLAKFSKSKLQNIKLLVYDFDGVMTDNQVITDQYGNESVLVNRGDGLAIAEIKKKGIKQIIISTEKNPVVKQRANKLGIPFIQGVNDKKEILLDYIRNNNIELDSVAYIGNDINDLEVMKIVGLPIAPKDAVLEIKGIAKIIIKSKGGQGVIRELLNLI